MPLMTLPFVRPPPKCQWVKMIRNEALIQLSVKLMKAAVSLTNVSGAIAAGPTGPRSAFGQVKCWDYSKSLTVLAYIES